MSEALASRLEALLQPISSDSPGGSSAREEPEYERVRAEIGRVAAEGAQAVEWGTVVSDADDLLENKTKDLNLATYRAVGRLMVDGFAGLTDGLDYIHGLCDRFWETLHPEPRRLRARWNALSWLETTATRIVRNASAKVTDRADLEAAVASLDRLIERIGTFDDETAPDFSKLHEQLKDKLDRLPRATSAPATPTAQAPSQSQAQQQPPAAPAGSAALDLSSPEGIERSTDTLCTWASKLAAALRGRKITDPAAYRLARIGVWMQLTLPTNNQGKTFVQPTGASITLAETWDRLVEQEEWATLAEQAEVAFDKSPFWLDTQRYAWLALDGMSAGPAANIVHADLADLLRKHPSLVELTFSNDLPFASEETRAWIADTVQAAAPSAGGQARRVELPEGFLGGDEQPLHELLERATGLADSKRLADAVELLELARERASDPRTAFVRRFTLARFLADRNENRLAEVHLGVLDEDVRRFDLESWDPSLVAPVLTLYCQVVTKLMKKEWKGSENAQTKADMIYARLGRIDPRAALDS